MKKILLIALMGFTAISSYAQNKNCSSKMVHHKMAYHHKVIHHSRVSRATNTYGPDYWPQAYVETATVMEPLCTQYREHNIVVTECPGIFYDNSDINGNVTVKSESSYTGYYPYIAEPQKTAGPLAPQHNTVDDNKVAPAGGNEFHNPSVK